MKILLVAIALSTGFFAPPKDISTSDIKLYPGEFRYEQSAKEKKTGYNSQVENLALINYGDEELVLETIEFEFKKNGKTINRTSLHGEDIYEEARKMFSPQKDESVSSDKQAKLRQVLEGNKFSSSRVVAPHEALMISKKKFKIKGKPDTLIITVKGYKNQTEAVSINYVSAIDRKGRAKEISGIAKN